MSEQIREQVSAFLDGELPSSETELLLKRLTRDPELRQSFGRYALIGESLRGAGSTPLSRGFSARVNQAIDGEPHAPDALPLGRPSQSSRWWRPMAGAAVAVSVAAVAVVALQQRAVAPKGVVSVFAGNVPREAASYTVPPVANAPAVLRSARLTNYVFAHTRYSSGLGQSSLSALLADPEEQVTSGGNADPAQAVAVSDVSLLKPAPPKDPRIAP
jgi:sigma-E factor negative regulatory protein RseA